MAWTPSTLAMPFEGLVMKHLSPREAQELSARTLTRVTIKEAIYNTCRSLTRAQAADLLDEVLEEIAQTLERGEEVTLRSFGKVKVCAKRQRIGRNPGRERRSSSRRDAWSPSGRQPS